ncbi:hypothetical protein [Nonomuraea soli]|uniref:DUF1579 domain-containing protein n=1 Tax=Nonomuraea soli TaxID=1032476 RepID=A0A7W0CCY3_9ACTN|nr:hypothetical protein [Nonomuraea soli]MBA2888861.1 hypothetical protein [Nonomuraea soli]
MAEFDFLVGVFDVRNRRKAVASLIADPAATVAAGWEQFPAVNTGAAFLGGQVVVDEYAAVLPDGREMAFVDVHAHDPGTGRWSNAIHARGHAPDWSLHVGRFENGVGTFYQELDGLRMRHTWDLVTPASARFRQAFSTDGGATWHDNWIMELSRRA